jgi:hypothetical protein
MNESTADEVRTPETDRQLSDLLDAAQRHLLSSEPADAIAVWERLIKEGGNAGDWGHLEYADYLFRRGREEDAHTQLAGLMAGRRVLGAPWSLAAELLEERGDLKSALFFFSSAVQLLTAEQLGTASAPLWARQLTAGQRRVKWALEVPLDDQDLLAEVGAEEMADKEVDLPGLLGRPRVIGGRLQFWARGQLSQALCLWPKHCLVESAEEYYRDVEREFRAHAGGRVVAVARTVRGVDAGPDPAIREARSKAEVLAILARADEGAVVEWPPGRNEKCWCGSGVEYEKCCDWAGAAMVGAASC